MRKYTGYRPGEERFDGHLYRLMVRAERKARENPRVNITPPQPPVAIVLEPKAEAQPAIHPLRQMLNAHKEEKEREKKEESHQILAKKAAVVALIWNKNKQA